MMHDDEGDNTGEGTLSVVQQRNLLNPDKVEEFVQGRESSLLSCHPILKQFRYMHLPPHLREISQGFSELAWITAARGGQFQEVEMALRKLKEAKDCAVCALVE